MLRGVVSLKSNMITVNGEKLCDIGYYINLDKREDRKQKLLSNLETFNVKGVERYSARTDNSTAGINLVNTTLDIYKLFLKSDAETLLILEDDCQFLEPLNCESKQIISDINSVNWDLFWLGCHHRQSPVYVSNNCYRVSSVSYAQSYIIKKPFAKEVIDTIEEHGYIGGALPDEILCLLAYSRDIAVNPNKFDFYKHQKPLESFQTQFISLCYKYALSTQYNSYSDLWFFETTLNEFICSSHPEKYKANEK